MYIQITTACNMTCDHCCFSATAKGKRMTDEIYEAALRIAVDRGEYITIGGGEPTTHRNFFRFLDRAIELYDNGLLEAPPFVVTNGKVTPKAHRLLDYVDQERSVHLALSQDRFHDPIDQNVVQRFKRLAKRASEYRNSYMYSKPPVATVDIRTVENIMPVGRAVEMGVYSDSPYEGWGQCCCEDSLVDPEGVVWSCGCKTHKLGTVWDYNVLDNYNHEYAHTGGIEPDEDVTVEEL